MSTQPSLHFKDSLSQYDNHMFEWLLCLTSTFRVCQRRALIQRESVSQQLSLCSKPLAATIISAPAEILKLTAFVSSLTPELGMLAPRFFLASVLPRDWKPCVVVVSQGLRIVGLLYCKERVVAGIATRIAFGTIPLVRW